MSRSDSNTKRLRQVPLGNSIRSEFHLELSSIHLNHGSYGATPKMITSAQTKVIDEMEKNVERFMKHERVKNINKARQEIAKLVHAEFHDLVLVVNATTGINAVFRSLSLEPGDEILCLNVAYPSVLNTLHYICTQKEIYLNVLDISLPLSSYDQLIDQVTNSITNKTKLAVFDHIASASALLLPVEQLIKVCHDLNIPTLIDGAHAPGQIPLYLNNLKSNFYVGNCHKWLFTSKGCAFLHVSKENQSTLRPVITSLAYNLGYEHEFLYQGTRDESNLMTIPVAIDFYENIGPSRIQEYNSSLMQWASKHLSDLWKTRVLIPSTQSAPFMSCIQLPFNWPTSYCTLVPTNGNPKKSLKLQLVCNHIVEIIRDKYQINTKMFPVQDEMYVRISAQIYNEKSDYIALGEAVQCLRDCDYFHEEMEKLEV